MLHIQTPCPTGWRYDPAKTIELARQRWRRVSDTHEFENGQYNINKKLKSLKPVEAYIKGQGRFKHLNAEEIEKLQAAAQEL